MKKIGYMPLNGGTMGQVTGPQKDRLQLVYNQFFWFLANWATGNWTDHNWSQLETAVQLWSVAAQSSCQSLHQLPTGLQNTNSGVEIRQPHLTTLELVMPNRAPWGMGSRDTASAGDRRPKGVWNGNRRMSLLSGKTNLESAHLSPF